MDHPEGAGSGRDARVDFHSRERLAGPARGHSEMPGKMDQFANGVVGCQQEPLLLFRNDAPAWGATADRQDHDRYHQVSIHAPAWGATVRSISRNYCDHCFDPRPRMGGDLSARLCCITSRGFDPRPRMGGDKVTL